MKKTKLFSLLMACVMLLLMLPVQAFAAEETVPAQVVSQQLRLGDDLTMRFYVTAKDTATVNVTLAGKTQQYPLGDMEQDSNGQYVIPVELAAAQMTEQIALEIFQDGASVLQKTYTVRDYAVSLLEGNYPGTTKALVRNMLAYGAAAQKYFGIQTDNFADTGYELTEDLVLPGESAPVTAEGGIGGIRFYGASLVFDHQIALRYYFTGSVDGVSFGKYEAEEKNGMHYVEVPGINPQDYDKSIVLTAAKGEEMLTVSYSPLNYIIRMSEKGSDSLKALLKAMYGYHTAAVEYVNNTGFFGSAYGYETAPQFDLTEDTGANKGTVNVANDGISFGYINDFQEENFYFEAKFHIHNVLESENWPKFGLFVQGENVQEAFFVDMNRELKASVVGVVSSTDGNFDWENTKSANVEGMAFSGEGEKVTLGVLKTGKRLHLFVNGNYAMSAVCGFEGSAVAGVFSFNTGLCASAYFADTTAATLEAKTELVPEGERTKGEQFGYAVGDGVTYSTSDGVDLSKDQAEDPSVEITGGAPQYTYLNDVFTDKFCFEAAFNVKSVLNNDQWPKFGMMVNGTSEMVKFFVDMTPAMTATHVGVVYQPTGGGDDWGNVRSCEVPGMAFSGSDTVKLKLIRIGRAYYFYVNDTLALYDEAGFKAENGAVGLFSFNTKFTASKYSILAGEDANAEINAARKQFNFFDNGNVDLTKDFGAHVGTVNVATGQTEFIWVKDFSAKDFYFETKVHVNEIYNNDGYPKFGIFAENESTRENFFVDMTTNKTASVVGVMTATNENDAWVDNWGGVRSETVEGMQFSGNGEYVTLGLKKEDGRFFLYVNGQFALFVDSAITGQATVGVFGFNTGMELKEYFINRKDGIESLLTLTTEGQIGTVELGGIIWTDKNHTFKEMPSEFVGESYIQNVMKSDITFDVKKDGYIYVLTPYRGHSNSIADELELDLYDRIETPAWYMASYSKAVDYWAYERTVKAGETITIKGNSNWHLVVVSELPIDPTLHQLKNYVFSDDQLAVLVPTEASGGTVETVANGVYPFSDRGADSTKPAKLQNLPDYLLKKSLIVDKLNDAVQATVTRAGKVFLIASTSDERKAYFTNSEQGYTFVEDLIVEYGNILSQSSYNNNGYGLYVKNVEQGDFERTRKSYWSIPIFASGEKLPAEPPVSIAITQMPDKTTYKLGESFDPTGMVVMGTDKYGNVAPLSAEQYVTVPGTFTAEAYAAAVILDDMVVAVPVTITDAEGNELTDEKEYDTSKYTTQKAPLLNGSVKRSTPEQVIAAIQKMEADGATAFNLHLTSLNEQYRNYESFKQIADCTDYPLMAIAYGDESSREYRINLMKEAVRAGFDIVDIRMDTFDADSRATLAGTVFENANPAEVSMNADVIAQQKALVQEFKDMGAEVLMSAHVGVSLTEAEGVALAKEMESRGADVAKIVLGSSANKMQQEVMQTNQTLKNELGIKFYYNASGTASKPYRTASVLIGTHMIFCYAEYHETNLDTYDYIKDLKAFYDTIPSLKEPDRMLKTNNNQKMDTVALGKKIWTNRDYVFTSMPETMIGKEFVKAAYGLSGQTVDVTVQRAGYIYVLTNAYKTDNSQAEKLDELNYTKLDMANWKFCNFSGNTSYIWVYEKYVEPGETLQLGQWSVVIASETKLDLESDTYKTADADMAVLKPLDEGASVGNMQAGVLAYANRTYTIADMPYWLAGKNYILGNYGAGSATVTRGGVVYMITNTGNSGKRMKYFEDAGYEKVNVPAFTAISNSSFADYEFVLYKKAFAAEETVSWPSWAIPVFSGDLILSEKIAKITPDGTTTLAAKYDVNVRLFNNRTYYASGDRLTALHGKSYLYATFEDGATGTVTEAGTVYVQIPVKNSNTTYQQLEADLIAVGYTPVAYRLFRNNKGIPGKSLGYAQKLYQKEVAVGETIHFGQYNIVYFDTLPAEDYYEMPSVTTAATIYNDPMTTGPKPETFTYDPADRNWQGCPVVTITEGPNGGKRMWAGWFTGGNNELAAHNCAILVYSDDEGKTWTESAVAIAHSDDTVSVTKPQLWTLDDGSLWVSWTQHTVYNDEAKFDGRMGTWAAVCKNPEASITEWVWSEPVRLFEGRGNGKITVLNKGQDNEEWLTTAFDWIDRCYSKVYSSTDKGKTWTFKGQAEVTGSTYNNAILVERKEENGDSYLWMLLRQLEGNMKESFSFDGGKTWTNATVSHIQHPNSAIYVGWTSSGKLLMINHKDFNGRNNLTAFLSEDGGKTWPYSILLDARSGVSYPDVIEDNGKLYVVYDYDRFNTGRMYMAKITEADIMAGELVTEGSYLKHCFSSMGINGPQVSENAQAIDLSDKEMSASSEGSPAGHAFDGNTDTRWCATSNDMPQWLMIDLKDVYNLESVYMFFEQKSDWNYKVETSVNGDEWSVYSDPEAQSIIDVTINGQVQARYVRLTVESTTGGAWASVWEMEVYANKDNPISGN